MVTSAPLAHIVRGPGEAFGLLFVSLTAVFAVVAFYLLNPPGTQRPRRALGTVAVGLAAASLVLADALPIIVTRTWAAARPSATARLTILSPLPGDRFRGDPATVPVQLRLVGGQLTPSTSTRVAPNIGHIHVYRDGKLISMFANLSGRISVGSGSHVVRASSSPATTARSDPPWKHPRPSASALESTRPTQPQRRWIFEALAQ
jgi:hypothetical protein